MDIAALKQAAAKRPMLWFPVVIKAATETDPGVAFKFQTRRMSMRDLRALDKASSHYVLVEKSVVHEEADGELRLKLYLDEVKDWAGVKVKHIVADVPEGFDGEEDVPFNRDLLTTLVDNYPVAIAVYMQQLQLAAMVHGAATEASAKN